MNEVDVIVTQGWGRIAYNIVRSLGRRGIKVCVGTDSFSGMAVYSRYKVCAFWHPSFVLKPIEFVKKLREAIIYYSPKVYIPSDQEAYVVARHIDEFKDLNVKIPIAPFGTIRNLHMKDESYSLSSSIGIPTPHTIVPKTIHDVNDFLNKSNEPIIVKKLSSSSTRGTYFLDKQTIHEFTDWMKLNNLRYGNFLLQQYVEGNGYGVSMLFNKGNLRAKFTHKRLEEISPEGGVSTQRISVINKCLEDYAEKLLNKVNYHGVAMVEFKYNEETQQSWFIEVNPRFWGSIALSIQAGVDFPYMLYKLALEGDVETVLNYRIGISVKWILGDLLRKINSLRGNRIIQNKVIKSYKVNGYDDFYWDDPLPFLAEGILAIKKTLITKKNKTKEDISLNEL